MTVCEACRPPVHQMIGSGWAGLAMQRGRADCFLFALESVLTGAHPDMARECAREIRRIGKSHGCPDFRHTPIRCRQHQSGFFDPTLLDVLIRRATCCFTEQSDEMKFAHIRQRAHLCQIQALIQPVFDHVQNILQISAADSLGFPSGLLAALGSDTVQYAHNAALYEQWIAPCFSSRIGPKTQHQVVHEGVAVALFGQGLDQLQCAGIDLKLIQYVVDLCHRYGQHDDHDGAIDFPFVGCVGWGHIDRLRVGAQPVTPAVPEVEQGLPLLDMGYQGDAQVGRARAA